VLQQIFYLISYCYTFLKMPLKIISSLSNRGESKPPPISSLIYFFVLLCSATTGSHSIQN
jgi:hypothetical protein